LYDAGLDSGQSETVLRAYYAARDMYIRACGLPKTPVPRQALFSTPQFRTLAVFGGQGGMDNYIDEVRSVFATYRPLLADFVARMSDFLQREAADPQFAALYPHGLDALRWIQAPDETPAPEYMITVPVCIPLVGLLQLMHVVVLYKTLAISPAELADRFQCKCASQAVPMLHLLVCPQATANGSGPTRPDTV
ncbi:beta subunit of fatty acid synthetase, partial [Coemansia spiralis]